MISTPDTNLPIPEDLQKHLDTVRNNITLNEAEVLRLQTLKGSLEYEITQLHNQKKYLEEETGKAKTEKTEAEAKMQEAINVVEEKKKELQQLEAKIVEVNTQNKTITDAIKAEQVTHEETKKQLQGKANELQERESAVIAKEQIAAHKDALATERHEKIKQAVAVLMQSLE